MAVLSRFSTSSHLCPPLFHFPTVRSYHFSAAATATAAAQLFDYDDDSGLTPPSPTPATVVDTDGSRPFRGVHWVFIGNPYAKKHIYADMISKLLHIPRISISTLLRQDLNPHSPLYKQIAEAVNCGKLVPESIIFGLLLKRLEDGHYRGENGFILDGIPRTHFQATISRQLALLLILLHLVTEPNPVSQILTKVLKVLSQRSLHSTESRCNIWRTTTRASRSLLIFKWEMHQEKHGKDS